MDDDQINQGLDNWILPLGILIIIVLLIAVTRGWI